MHLGPFGSKHLSPLVRECNLKISWEEDFLIHHKKGVSINWANGPLREVSVEFGEVQGPLETILQIRAIRCNIIEFQGRSV